MLKNYLCLNKQDLQFGKSFPRHFQEFKFVGNQRG